MPNDTSNQIDTSTGTIEEEILSARNSIREGHLDQASELLNKLISSDPSGYANLQLANAYLYLENYSKSLSIIDRLLVHAKAERDALLTIAALLTKGEALIDSVTFLGQEDEVQSAIESFGKALGIAELFGEEKLSILPLAGLAHAHWLWGNPRKAAELSSRSTDRAQAIEADERELFLARAYLSTAIHQQTPEAFQKAIGQAEKAKHTALGTRIKRFQKLYQPQS